MKVHSQKNENGLDISTFVLYNVIKCVGMPFLAMGMRER